MPEKRGALGFLTLCLPCVITAAAAALKRFQTVLFFFSSYPLSPVCYHRSSCSSEEISLKSFLKRLFLSLSLSLHHRSSCSSEEISDSAGEKIAQIKALTFKDLYKGVARIFEPQRPVG